MEGRREDGILAAQQVSARRRHSYQDLQQENRATFWKEEQLRYPFVVYNAIDGSLEWIVMLHIYDCRGIMTLRHTASSYCLLFSKVSGYSCR